MEPLNGTSILKSKNRPDRFMVRARRYLEISLNLHLSPDLRYIYEYGLYLLSLQR
ncbi:MAG: hypothetical protein PWP72_66 [Thermoanaerobacter sp.]|jgi:hypothetical protein|nr:hypothetical protein [Thermoanaerobacter sp.]